MIRRWALIFVLALATGCSGTTGQPPPASVGPSLSPETQSPGVVNGQDNVVQVTRVVDGDTIVVTGVGTVRIRGINTPETVKPRSPVECFGPEASQFTKTMLPPGKTVSLVFDYGDLNDQYGRRVAEIWMLLDGSTTPTSFAKLALQAGVARLYVFRKAHPPSDLPELQAAQADAQSRHFGLWGACPA